MARQIINSYNYNGMISYFVSYYLEIRQTKTEGPIRTVPHTLPHQLSTSGRPKLRPLLIRKGKWGQRRVLLLLGDLKTTPKR